jgi:hypothetical protein
VFGSRFIDGGAVIGYPIHKLILNQLANLLFDRETIIAWRRSMLPLGRLGFDNGYPRAGLPARPDVNTAFLRGRDMLVNRLRIRQKLRLPRRQKTL